MLLLFEGVIKMEWKTLRDWILKFVLTPGGAGGILYFVLEKVPYIDKWFAGLASKAKRLVTMGLSIAIPLAFTGVAIGFGYLSVNEDTFFMAFQLGFVVYLGSQVLHLRDL